MKRLNLQQMENVQGGYNCVGLSKGLKGAATIMSIATAVTGFGAVISASVFAAGFTAELLGC
ncbi:hypothetical protein [Capnocytophaga haemolytica]